MTDDDVMESIGRTLGASCLSVYWVLCKHADKQRRCHPSEERIAAMVSLTTRSVRTCIAKLKDGKWITITPRKNQYGVVTTNEYELLHHFAPHPEEAPEEAPEEDLKLNASSKVIKRSNKRTNEEEDTSFEQFYSAYPRKVSPSEARKAWHKVDPPLPIVLADIERRLASGEWVTNKERIQYIPHPTTYLNQRRWEDTPPPQPTPEDFWAEYRRTNPRI